MQCMQIAKPRAWVSIEDAGELKPDLKVPFIAILLTQGDMAIKIFDLIQRLGLFGLVRSC